MDFKKKYLKYKNKYLELKKQLGGNRKSFLEQLKKKKLSYNTFLRAKVLKALYDAIHNDSIDIETKFGILQKIFPKSIFTEELNAEENRFHFFYAFHANEYIDFEIDAEKWTFLDMDHSHFDSKLQNYFLELFGKKNSQGTYILEDNDVDINDIYEYSTEHLIEKLQDVSSRLFTTYPNYDHEYRVDSNVEYHNNELETAVKNIDLIPGYGIEYLELAKNTTYEQKKQSDDDQKEESKD